MKVLAIRGRNLASLAGEFDVDFTAEPLASAGLFAISGPTGAGKSTLLDALCLALYNQTPRMVNARGRNAPLPDVGGETIGPQDPRTLLRRGTAEAHAEVDFVGNDGAGYRARWSVRRARSKAGGKLQDAQMSLHRLADLQPVGGSLKNEVLGNIHERIGLSFEQFTRAVLLAQNEFSAFLKADDDERAKLLQTLTGTDRFEVISQRAFERNKTEQEALRVLNDRLATQRPLDALTRAHWEQERATRQTAADAVEARARLLEAHLRWHHEREQALLAQTQASDTWQAALAASNAAAQRRLLRDNVEAAQTARPLVTEANRLATERTAQRQHCEQAHVDVGRATGAERQAGGAVQLAQGEVDAARLAQTTHAPALAQARELDAIVAAQAPEHDEKRRARDAAAQARHVARQKLAAEQGAHRQAVDAHAQTSRWLDAHAGLAALAQRWDGWNALFAQAGALGVRTAQAAEAFTGLATLATQAREALALATSRRDAATQAVTLIRTEQAGLGAGAAGIDRDALAEDRRAADARRDTLIAASAAWTTLAELRERRADLDSQAAKLAAALAQGEARRQQAVDARPAAAAAELQAHRSWQLAYAASQASVETLRGTLEDDIPCPVCGALDHPYTRMAAPMRNALGALETEHRRCREALADIDANEAGQRTLIATQTPALAAIREKASLTNDQLALAQQRWQALPIATEAERHASAQLDLLDTDTGPAAWLERQLAQAGAAQQAVLAREAALRAYDRDSTALRLRLEQAATALQAESTAVQQRETQAAELTVRRDAAAATQAEQRSLLAAVLAELDDAVTQAAGPAWQSAWHADPASFRAARHADAEAWSAHRTERDTLAQRIAGLVTAGMNATEGLDVAAEHEREAAARFDLADRTLAAHRMQRAALFQETAYAEMTVTAVDTVLGQATATAMQKLEALRAAHAAARQEHARVSEAAAQADRRLATIDTEALAADGKVAAWLAAYPGSDPLDAATLHAWLGHDADWMANERTALQQLDQNVLTSRTRTDERKAKLAEMDGARPTDAPVADVQAEHAAVSEAMRAAKDHVAEAALTLRADDERRAQGSALMAGIEAQERIARVWQSMNELIGSADGKKFRNFAQQLTLDILLGYANRHLAALSRRYRLERVKQSLALLVIDQDMADEVRSVHSLSGGESFLVSLALALGLASLSSHRVRVESLFIDEGFGSLDADTLRVAMDALDSLQAQGRKVGVISHVQEMTERIGTRIEIRRQAGGQSTLVMSQAS